MEITKINSIRTFCCLTVFKKIYDKLASTATLLEIIITLYGQLCIHYIGNLDSNFMVAIPCMLQRDFNFKFIINLR